MALDPHEFRKNEVEVIVEGIRVRHRLPGPWRASGTPGYSWGVKGAVDINYLRFPDYPGQTRCNQDFAEKIAAALNKEHGNG